MGAILSPSDPEAGRRLSPVRQTMQALQKALDGRYVLEGVLGKGGMGVVYLARETALDRLVALKILPPGEGNRDRERFLQEAKIAARLKHDHIVPIHTVDHAGPFVYYTMDYIPGETLAQRIITDGPLPVGEATRILRDVAQAVEYAHKQGIIHRDLKPQNILLERGTGRAYVADLGLARVIPQGPLPGGGRGPSFVTWVYTSPEQAAGRPAGRSPERRLLARRRGLRDGHRPAPVQRNGPGGPAAAHLPAGASAARAQPAPGHHALARAGPLPGQGSGGAISDRGGAGPCPLAGARVALRLAQTAR